MGKVKKALLLVLCAVLLVGASVAGTVAYLTSQDVADNTFTVGKVEIDLKEYQVDPQTGLKTETEVEELKDLELVPGRKIEKKPIIKVDTKSEPCWLFVKIENNLGDAVKINGLTENEWQQVAEGSKYYMHKKSVAAGAIVPVFDSITCNTAKTYEQLNGIANKNIKITAYAVQADGVDATDAWNALGQHYTLE